MKIYTSKFYANLVSVSVKSVYSELIQPNIPLFRYESIPFVKSCYYRIESKKFHIEDQDIFENPRESSKTEVEQRKSNFQRS